MQDEHQINPAEGNDEKPSFESDTQKIIHRHLQNEDDIISEEDIRNVRVGMTPPQSLSDAEDAAALDEVEKDANEEGEGKDSSEQITPWDVVDE